METRLMKWGNSQGVRLPKTILEEANLKTGDRVELIVRDGDIVISSARPRHSLQQLLSGITPDNLHGEVSTGRPTGREVW
ncbi:MAG: AbrB/MazE/SpoVT family DNA-binding domain-containing protein [Candidatus Lambdaproteobacteria bacterium]|nr:AbrB/MazE/SpoVT family DNA-binding domain-containing protein [Candidatus Lambdaproteobacteria bacterium]